jgi:predicted permease
MLKPHQRPHLVLLYDSQVSMGILVASMVHFTLGYSMLRPSVSTTSQATARQDHASSAGMKDKLDVRSLGSNISASSTLLAAWDNNGLHADAVPHGDESNDTSHRQSFSTRLSQHQSNDTDLSIAPDLRIITSSSELELVQPSSHHQPCQEQQRSSSQANRHQHSAAPAELSQQPAGRAVTCSMDDANEAAITLMTASSVQSEAQQEQQQRLDRHPKPGFLGGVSSFVRGLRHSEPQYSRLREAQASAGAGEAVQTSVAASQGEGSSCSSVIKRSCSQAWSSSWPVLAELKNPPSLSCFLALLVGTTPALKALFFSSDGLLRVVGSTIDMVGNCTVPLIVILLGATLEAGPGAVPMPFRVIVAVCVCRLLLMPLIGLGVVMGAYSVGLFKCPDPMFLLVMLLQNTMPTALNVHAIATIHRNRENELACLMFWQYLMTVLVVPAWLMLYLYIAHLYF